MVGYDIDDDLDTVLVSLGAKRGQLTFGAEPGILGDRHADRLVELPPLSCYVSRRRVVLRLLNRRGLNSGITRRSNRRQGLFDCVVRPVERVQYDAVLDIRLQMSVCGNFVRRADACSAG